MHQYKDEFENIPTDLISGNVDSIDMNELFFNKISFKEQHTESLLIVK